ncbi:sugar ABC transporter permease [Clostridia bacterium]|nr:sugar ABC transporter permease [Clostridia bacterium]
MKRVSIPYKIFTVFNYIVCVALALSCVLPLVNLFAVSFSAKAVVEAGGVGLWPRGFNADAYGYIFSTAQFWNSLKVSVLKTVLGTLITLILTICLAYPLSRKKGALRGRSVYMAVIIFCMLFSGGLVPTYLLVANTLNMKNTLWALILPGGVQIFSAVIMMNFFRQLPGEIEEAAHVDGADHFRSLFLIVLPCSLPIIATVVLFAFVGNWNSWFDGLIYMTQPEMYPLQTFLQQYLKEPPGFSIGLVYKELSEDSMAAANIFIIMVPLIAIYPFLQKYFIKGIVLGSVKG